MEKHTPYFTPFADDSMRKYIRLCQKAKIYKGLQSPKNQEKLRNARLCNNDKSTLYLPRQYFPKTLKTLNLSYVLDSEGAIY